MRRAFVLVCTWAILVLVSGCGSTPGDAEMKQFIAYMDQATSTMDLTRKKLIETVGALEKKENVTVADFEPALKEADRLRDPGKKLVEFKGELERIGETLTEDQREYLRTEHQGSLQNSMNNMLKAHRELQKYLNEEVRAKTKISDSEFQLLQKRFWESSEEYLVLSRLK